MAQREHEAEPGDLIEIFRSGFQHWAVYIGDDEVVHLTTPDDMGPSNSGSPFSSISSISSVSPFSSISSISSVSPFSSISSISSVSPFSSSSSGSVAQVKRENIWDVVGHCRFKVNNDLDKKWKPRDPRVIVKEACEMVGKKVRYSVAAANCEHFVTDLRYGRAMSRQVIKVLSAVAVGTEVFVVTAVAAPAVAASAAAAAAVYAFSWLFKKS